MRRAWPFVRAAASELALVGALAIAGGLALLAADRGSSTRPLIAVAVAALWGGVVVGGGGRTALAHLLTRPIDRGSLLAYRVATLGVVLLGAAIVVHGIGEAVGAHAMAPPLSMMFVLVGICSVSGVLAGALAHDETHALGAAFIGAAVGLVPVAMLGSALRLEWSQMVATLGPWEWPFAIAIVASALLPIVGVWSTTPHRTTKAFIRGTAGAVAVVVVQFLLGWLPVSLTAANGGSP